MRVISRWTAPHWKQRSFLLCLLMAATLLTALACRGEEPPPPPTAIPTVTRAVLVPSPSPSPSPSPTAPGVTDQQTYTVQPGDTMFSLALRFGVTVQALAEANNIDDPDLISVGQVLIIPAN